MTPRVLDQEMPSDLLPDCWEGACTVTGTLNGQPVSGNTYTEVTPVQQYPL